MTRAAEQLIVCGIDLKKRPDGCWYDLVLQGLRGQPGFSEHETDGLKLWRYRKIAPGTPERARDNTVSPVVKPVWLKRPLAAAQGTRVLTPSSGTDAQGRPRASTSEASGKARQRGNIVHRLLQSLPEMSPPQRAQAMQDFLARQTKLDAAERSSLAGQVMAVLEDPRFAELFAPGSRAEVPIVGQVQIGGKTIRVSGQVDRLAITQDAVLIGDFKTNRNPPQRTEIVAPRYVEQLSLYRAVLTKLYPGRPIRAALIWTEAPDLMELSAEVLDAALAEVTTK